MSLAASLARAELRLAAGGLSGARAFDALVAGLQARLGDDVAVHPLAAEVLAEVDLTGDLLDLAWERFFPEVFKSSRGQFFTPPALARLVVALAEIRPGDEVLDPTCGAGGLLRLAAASGARVRGVELDRGLAALASVQLRLAGAGSAVECGDWFATDRPPADVVIANPPFSVAVTAPSVLARYTLGAGRHRVASEELFVESLAAAVAPGGRAVVILPWSILHNARKRPVFELLERGFALAATVALPEGVFRPFGGAAGRAVVLVLHRRPCAEVVRRFAQVHDPGYDVRSVHLRPTSSGEIDRLIAGAGWAVPTSSRVRDAVAVGELARVVPPAAPGAAHAQVVDLADVDRQTGEATPRPATTAGRQALAAGQVWVSRMRPELGTVGYSVAFDEALAGSPEWIALEASASSGWLAAALRTPTWRASLPVTSGQTRPRTTPEAILESRVRTPGDLALRWTLVTGRLLRSRARLRRAMLQLQAAMDAYQAGEIEIDALEAALAAAEVEG